ncbi:MAG: 50S ribosomal protein L24 [Nitrososphaerales archaeon]
MREAPNHVKSSMVGATLSPELREKYGVRSVRIRKDDSVKVLRGEFKGVEGKVIKVFTESGRINVEGVTREKIAGGSVPIKIHASNIMLTSLNLDDSWRRKKLEKGAS